MPCCKAEEYEWCRNLGTIKIEGKEYCVFHASEEHKNQTDDNYNKLIFKRIQESIDIKSKCDLSGTIFPCSIKFSDFHKDNSFPQISFKDAIFNGYADFNFEKFSSDADFYNATFKKGTSFYHAIFKKGVGFHLATFTEFTSFSHTTFTDAFFDSATFNGRTEFKHATFDGHAGFNNATFKKKSDFIQTTFSNYADFNLATFKKPANFNGAIFSSDTVFIDAKFVGETMFIDTKFEQKSSFRSCKVDHRMYFENVNISSVSFIDADIKNMIFQSCKWFKKYKYGRNKVADELELKNEKSKSKLLAYEKVEDLYRKLKNKYKAENNETEVSNWHYGEKEMFRKKLKRRKFNPVSFSNLYWAFSGYGERPIRAGIVLILLFSCVTILMNFFGLISTSGQEIFGVKIIKGFYGVIEGKKFWLLIYNTIQNALFIKATFFKPQTIAGAIILTITTKLIIPIQAALFLFALRNKFRR